MFRIKESYRIRHNILNCLFKEAEKEANPQMPTKRITSIELSKKTKIPIDKIDVFHELLHEEEEVECCSENNVHKMFLTSKGRQSYIDKKYLIEGRKAYWDSLYDPLKIVFPILTLLFSGYAIYLNSNSNKRVEANEKEINEIKEMLKNSNDTISVRLK